MPRDGLIIIDPQIDFLDRLPDAERGALTKAINRLAEAFRRAGAPVVWVRQEFKPDLSDAYLVMRDTGVRVVIAGTRGAEFDPALDVRRDEVVLTKKRYSAFFGTNLDARLAGWQVDRITLAGVNTHACVRMTAIDAYQRDLRVQVAKDAVASNDPKHARVSLAYMGGKIATILPVDQIERALAREAGLS